MKATLNDRYSISVGQLSDEISSHWIKCIDGPVAKVADQDLVAERPKVSAGESGDSPRRV